MEHTLASVLHSFYIVGLVGLWVGAAMGVATLIIRGDRKARRQLNSVVVHLPTPSLYAHELIRNGGGVWLGCNDKEVLVKAHDSEETGEEILTLYTEEQLLAYGDAREGRSK